ncbi:sialate O-acetylesterase-like [Oscarella lobularis]|uniref:sialate O-acetylesterase-like n=1 Tax=Oscarella lobularis TaxID=121494 RepID=UPI0033141D9E
MIRSLSLILALLLLAAAPCTGLKMNYLFSDGAILQTTDDDGHPPLIFGTANASAKIVITIVGGNFPKLTAQASATGQWNATLPQTPTSHPGPYNFTVEEYSSNNTTVVDKATFDDVYFGDVYFCSGQSNMGFAMRGTTNAVEELAKSNGYTNVRLFTVPRSPGPVSWLPCNNKTVAPFSAVCYLSAERVMEMYSKGRHIGLILSAVGGTGVQQWSSNETERICGHSSSRLSSHYVPASLFATMVVPYMPYAVRAAIWYQGEANADECCPIGRADYTCYLERMIAEWRALWGCGVPFVVVQIHAFGYFPCDSATPIISSPQAGVRLAQWDVGRHAPNDTFLVTACDQGGPLHPPWKTEVGRRVALAIVANVFKQTVAWRGPSIVNGTANHTATTQQFDVDLVLENGKGIRLVDTPACNGTSPDKCTRYCCKGGAPGLFILEGYDWSTTYTVNLYNLMVTKVADDSVQLSMLGNQTFGGKAHLARLLYAVGSDPTCAVVNSDGIAMATQGPIYLAIH